MCIRTIKSAARGRKGDQRVKLFGQVLQLVGQGFAALHDEALSGPTGQRQLERAGDRGDRDRRELDVGQLCPADVQSRRVGRMTRRKGESLPVQDEFSRHLATTRGARQIVGSRRPGVDGVAGKALEARLFESAPPPLEQRHLNDG